MLGEFVAFATLLFVVRFILRGHLVQDVDEDCTLGGVAVDLLAYGVRFPLAVYAPNNYENGFFYSGLLTAASFSVLGRNVLALKLPTHLIVSMGAVATLWLLRGCLDELRLTARSVRWTAIAVLIVATAFSPRLIAFYSTCTVGIGSHPEGAAIDMVLLALFARRRADWSPLSIGAFWVLVGLALHVNKGTVILVVVLAFAELQLARSSPRPLAAACVGFLLGSAPAFVMLASGNAGAGGGWETIGSKVLARAQHFPFAFASTVLSLAEHRAELLTTWLLAIGLALTLLESTRRRSSARNGANRPSALGLTVGLLLLHVAALTVMAQGGVDYYAMHTYPPLVVVTAVLAGSACSAASKEWGVRGGSWAGATIVGVMILVHRPDALTPGFGRLSTMWSNRAGAACSWRFAEGFLQRSGDDIDTRQQRAIKLCRTLSEVPQILDCIGGIARDLEYGSRKVAGAPPPSLTDVERRAFAFYYGVRRFGHATPCNDFVEPALQNECRTAVQLDCFNLANLSTRYESGDSLARPRCEIPPPPLDGYYAEMRSALLSRPGGSLPKYEPDFNEESMGACRTLVDACY